MYRAMLVGDNRDRANVGCRATSIALSHLLEARFELEARVSGTQVQSPQPPRRFKSNRLARKIATKAGRSELGWRGSARLPAGLRPDQLMAPPHAVARGWLDEAGRDQEIERLVRSVENADIVIVNGEGDLILTNPPRRKLVHLLAITELAHLLGTPAVYVNAMVSDPPDGSRNLDVVGWCRHALSPCRLVALRDKQSLALTQELDLHGEPRWVPDALFSWYGELPAKLSDDQQVHRGWPYEGDGLDLEWEHYVCVGGSSAYQPSALEAPIDTYGYIVEQIRERGHNPVLVESGDAEPYLRQVARRTGAPLIPWTTNISVIGSILARSQLFLSGRHHPAILAALGGSRPVMLGSNSHKGTSLLALLELDQVERPATLTSAEASALLDDTLRTLEGHDTDARSRLQQRCAELARLATAIPSLIEESLSNR